MTEDEMKEIEAEIEAGECDGYREHTMLILIAEVRRLRELAVLDDDAIDKLAVRMAQKMMDTPISVRTPREMAGTLEELARMDGRGPVNRWMDRPLNAEWEFDVAPDKVDLARLWNELRDGPAAIYQYAYLEQLRKNAPRTYQRLRKWRMDQGCLIFNWPEADATESEVKTL